MESASSGSSDDLESKSESEADSATEESQSGLSAGDVEPAVAAADVRNLSISDAPANDGESKSEEPTLPPAAQVQTFTAAAEAKKARKEAKRARQKAKARVKAAKAAARAKAKAAKAKAKARAKAKLSASQIRRLNTQVKSFLMKTLDDKHIRVVNGLDKAYDIYQAICDRYNGTKVYGDLYTIMNFLFNARYKEDDDITEFILVYEDAMAGLNTVLNISLDDNVASVFLFNAMPASWEGEMRIWRGNRDIIPDQELKNKCNEADLVTSRKPWSSVRSAQHRDLC